jgi:hypothetical protein
VKARCRRSRERTTSSGAPTAIGTCSGAWGRGAARLSLAAELREIGGIAQTALTASAAARDAAPVALTTSGLDSTAEWYLSTVERQLGMDVTYGAPARRRSSTR